MKRKKEKKTKQKAARCLQRRHQWKSGGFNLHSLDTAAPSPSLLQPFSFASRVESLSLSLDLKENIPDLWYLNYRIDLISIGTPGVKRLYKQRKSMMKRAMQIK